MKKNMLWPLLCIAAFAGALMGKDLAMIKFEEKLGLAWRNELVHHDARFDKGAVFDAASIVVQEQGGQVVVSQLSDVSRYDDGSIESCRVWFYVDLEPLQKRGFAIKQSKNRTGSDSGLRVERKEGSVTVTTAADGGRAGIRLFLGRVERDVPLPAAGSTGPVQALVLPSGRETGGGRFEVPFMIKSMAGEVTAAGPLFAEVQVRTVFDTGCWVLRARLEARKPVVFIEEEFDTGYSGQQMASSMKRKLDNWQPVDRFYSLVLRGKGSRGFAPAQVFYGARNSRAELMDVLGETVPPQLSDIRSNWVAAPLHGFSLKPDLRGDLFYLTGYPSVMERVGRLVRVVEPGGEAVGVAGLHAERWHNPMSLRLRVNNGGELLLSLPLQTYEQEWLSDGFGRFSPNYTGKELYDPPFLARRSYAITLGRDEDEKSSLLGSLFALGAAQAPSLDEVQRMTLDWDDGVPLQGGVAETTEKGAAALATVARRIEIIRYAGDLARFSMAYHFGFSKNDFPKLQPVVENISNELAAADRKLFMRRLAFLAYDFHAQRRFPFGNGFHLNNPNMTMMAVDARLKTSSLVKRHPMTAQWGAGSLWLTKMFLERFVRPSGAPFENPHYVLGVTLSDISEANEVMLAQGIGDAFDSDKVRRLMEFVPNWLTPPDPRFLGHRLALPFGNASYQSFPPAMSQRVVRYLAPRYPELAASFQWAANQTLPDDKKITLVQDAAPRLGSIHYKDYGVFFRHGFGTPYETLFFMMAGNCFGHYELETDHMAYTLFAKGQPINLHFGNGYFPAFVRPWLRNRVTIDHKREVPEREEPRIVAVALSAGADYVQAMKPIDQVQAVSEYPPERGQAEPPVGEVEEMPLTEWRRQVLFLKDNDPRGPNYFVLRDSFTGTPTRPTDMSLWFLANGMERNGDLYHFDGQCEVDMDLFVASPAGADPETGSYGHVQQPYDRLVGFDPKYHPGGKLGETQRFVRFRRAAGEGYLVVLYPRLKKDDAAATFERLGEFAVRVKTPLSVDTVFLSTYPQRHSEAGLEFNGCAASLRAYADGRRVVQNYEGSATIKVDGVTLKGSGPFVVDIQNGRVVGALPTGVSLGE